MKVVAYLNFAGTCEAAFKYYERLLGGKIEALLPFASTPEAESVPADFRGKIMHARLVLAPGQELMGSDAPADRHRPRQGFHVSLMVDSIAEAERVFRGLADGGEVEMPLEQAFWVPRFGMVVDRFGTPWMVNVENAG